MKKLTNKGKIITLLSALLFVLIALISIIATFVINTDAGVLCLVAVWSTVGLIVMYVLHRVL